MKPTPAALGFHRSPCKRTAHSASGRAASWADAQHVVFKGSAWDVLQKTAVLKAGFTAVFRPGQLIQNSRRRPWPCSKFGWCPACRF